MNKLLTSDQYLNSKAAFGRTQEGNSYAISQLPCGSRVVLIPGYPPLPAEIAACCAGKDAWISQIQCICRDCRQPFALRDLQGGQWCNECATKDVVD